METDVLVITSADGVVFERNRLNAECCAKQTISQCEDGTHIRWPIVIRPEGEPICVGGSRKTFQEWLRGASKYKNGICINEWLYYAKGIYP